MKRENLKENFKINLTKEVYQMKTEEGCYLKPYREYQIDYFSEKYKVIVDDKKVGVSSGSYKAFIYLIHPVGRKKEQLIYKYEYEFKGKNPYIFIYSDSSFEDIISEVEKIGIVNRK